MRRSSPQRIDGRDQQRFADQRPLEQGGTVRKRSKNTKALSKKLLLAAIILLFAFMQFSLSVYATRPSSQSSLEQLSRGDAREVDRLVAEDAGKTNYECFPGRNGNANKPASTATIYLETAHVNMHYETYYSFIHEICSCNELKDPHWSVSTAAPPKFYVGPSEMLTVGFENILREFNTTTCGPIYFDTPQNPDLTVVTTSYPDDFKSDGRYHKKLNNTRYVFICHADGGAYLEHQRNVFFLTPRHERHIVPSYFPPTIVQKYSKSIREQHDGIGSKPPPIFLVLGSFNNRYRRNIDSLVHPLSAHRNVNFTVRFLGGASHSAKNERLLQILRDNFPRDYHKMELLPRTDTDEFMRRVAEADVILPLVESGNFYHEDGYQGGKKLTSSVMWGLGFRKKMVIYRPLADVFGIEEDNATYFLHGESTARTHAFYEAFTRCLDYVLSH